MNTEATPANVGSMEWLGVMRKRPKFIVFDRSETAAESIASDTATFLGLALCIWLSYTLGGGVWQVICVGMFLLWTLCRMPWERASRTTLLTTKREAIEWAQALDDDA